MDAISYEYPKPRREFGMHPTFGDSAPQIVSLPPDETSVQQWTRKMKATVELDCIPQMAHHEANTEMFVTQPMGSSHTDGAWPAEVKTNEYVDRQRLLRRIKNEPGYQQAVVDLVKTAEAVIQQNNTLDLYQQYFDTAIDDYASEPPSCKTVVVFKTPEDIKRAANKICWHPDLANKVAVSYSVTQFQQMPDRMPLNSYIWDVNHPNEPDATISPRSPLCCLVYNPRSPDQLIGGSYNGMIGFWDLRKGSQPTSCSVLENSHHDPVYDVFWIQSRTGNECCSVSTDGQLLWWDTRKLEDGPTDSMVLSASAGENKDDKVFGGTSLEYRSDAGATRYLIGTEQGVSMLVDRKAKKDDGSSKSIKTMFGANGGRHMGPVVGLQRNPFNVKSFLSVGDWTARVWMEDIKSPLITTPFDTSYLTGGCWSPTRPGVFFTTKSNGTMDVWDYFYKQNEPVFSTKAGEAGLTSIRVQSGGRLVALGSQDGSCTILELSSSLYEPQTQGNLTEKAGLAAILDRETKREKHFEVRMVMKQRDALAATKTLAAAPSFDPDAEEDPAMVAKLTEIEAEYYATLEKLKGKDEGTEEPRAEEENYEEDAVEEEKKE